jgi:hypothetical protein
MSHARTYRRHHPASVIPLTCLSSRAAPAFEKALQAGWPDGNGGPGRVADVPAGPKPVQQARYYLPPSSHQPGQLLLTDVVRQHDARVRTSR